MEKIVFIKNDVEIPIDAKLVSYDKENLVIQKEDEQNVITLDFKKRTCTLFLKEEKLELEIPVLNMSYEQMHEYEEFVYTLESESAAKNVVKIFRG